MAPTTKYGGKIVECQPGSCAIAKSRLTTECTEMTRGVASPPSSPYMIVKWRHCSVEPRQPSAKMPYTRRRSLVPAATSHGSELLNCGHTPIGAGYGINQ